MTEEFLSIGSTPRKDQRELGEAVDGIHSEMDSHMGLVKFSDGSERQGVPIWEGDYIAPSTNDSGTNSARRYLNPSRTFLLEAINNIGIRLYTYPALKRVFLVAGIQGDRYTAAIDDDMFVVTTANSSSSPRVYTIDAYQYTASGAVTKVTVSGMPTDNVERGIYGKQALLRETNNPNHLDIIVKSPGSGRIVDVYRIDKAALSAAVLVAGVDSGDRLHEIPTEDGCIILRSRSGSYPGGKLSNYGCALVFYPNSGASQELVSTIGDPANSISRRIIDSATYDPVENKLYYLAMYRASEDPVRDVYLGYTYDMATNTESYVTLAKNLGPQPFSFTGERTAFLETQRIKLPEYSVIDARAGYKCSADFHGEPFAYKTVSAAKESDTLAFSTTQAEGCTLGVPRRLVLGGFE